MKLCLALVLLFSACALAQLPPTPTPPPPPPPPPNPKLVHQVQPVYPPQAKEARVQGEVVLLVTIDKAGAPSDVRVVRGHPMLVNAAIDAVKEWRWQPYLIEGAPAEVKTRITVNFQLPPKEAPKPSA